MTDDAPSTGQDAEIYIVARRKHAGADSALERHISLEALAEMFDITPQTAKRKARARIRPWPHHERPVPGGSTPVFCEHDIEWITHELQTEAHE